MSSNGVDSGNGGVQSVDRALYILELLARRGEAGVTELASDIGVHKSTVSRLLAALEDRELVEQAFERVEIVFGHDGHGPIVEARPSSRNDGTAA